MTWSVEQNKAVLEILQERDRQDAKWGSQRTLTKEKWMLILMEEVGETTKEILEQNEDLYHKELVQVAAVALAALESFHAQRVTKGAA